MGFINTKNLSNLQQFITNKLFSQEKNVSELSLFERIEIAYYALKNHDKAFAIMNKNNNFYFNLCFVAETVVFPSDNKTMVDLINVAFKVALKDVLKNGTDEEMVHLMSIHAKINEELKEYLAKNEPKKITTHKGVTL